MTATPTQEIAASGFQHIAARIERAMAYASPDVFDELREIKAEARALRDAILGAVQS
jgi:hypothetical protein